MCYVQNYYGSEFLGKNSIIKGSTLGLVKVPKNYTIAIINSITQNLSNERDELLKSSINIEIDMSSNLHLKAVLNKNIIITKIKLFIIKSNMTFIHRL